MDIADNVEFRNRLIVLADLFDVKLSPQRQALYFEALRDLAFDAVANAFGQAAKTCKFFPKPVELRSLAVGDVEDQAETAWMDLKRAMGRVGSYSSLITDATLGEAIRAVFGSWPEACTMELSPEMWTAKRKEFGRVYRVLRDRQLVGSRYLPGLCEIQNAGIDAWAKYVPVAQLMAGDVQVLRASEADAARTAIAATSHGFSLLRDNVDADDPLGAPDGEPTHVA